MSCNQFILKINTDFSAAHALRGYDGDCARIHGHNWKVEAEVVTSTLNDIGIGIDFKDMKKALKEIIAVYDHQYVNEIEPFNTINPTAENMAMHFYNQLTPIINLNPNTKLKAITIWETDRASVRYEAIDN